MNLREIQAGKFYRGGNRGKLRQIISSIRDLDGETWLFVQRWHGSCRGTTIRLDDFLDWADERVSTRKARELIGRVVTFSGKRD